LTGRRTPDRGQTRKKKKKEQAQETRTRSSKGKRIGGEPRLAYWKIGGGKKGLLNKEKRAIRETTATGTKTTKRGQKNQQTSEDSRGKKKPVKKGKSRRKKKKTMFEKSRICKGESKFGTIPSQ